MTQQKPLSMTVYKIFAYGFSTSLLLSLPAHAEKNNETPQIIVTANRTANTIDETLAAVSIITKEDIQRIQATSVMDILKTTPGLDFSSNGGMGSTQSIYMRGTNSDQILILIDGVPSGSATLGTTPFENLPISQIERIEVVRGPHSSLYGSSAIGGVIQIFTNKGQQGQHSFTNAGYGSDNTREVNAGISGGNQSSAYSFSIGYQDTDGYNVLGNTYPDTDDDGFDNTSLSLGGSHQFNDQFKISGSFLYSEGKNEYDRGLLTKETHAHFKEQIASITADYQFNDFYATQLLLGQSVDDSKDHPGGTASNDRFKTTKEIMTWKNEFIIRDQDFLTIGIDYLDESINSTNDYSEDSRWNKALFSQYQYYGDVFDVKIAWRYDDNESFGSHNTGSIAIGFDLDKHIRVTTSWGTAFKAPSFNDLYWPQQSFPSFFYTYEGNPNLKPEESESFEFGLSGNFKSVSWTAHYYQTNITNLISNQGQLNPVTFFWEERPENIGKANIDGIELTLKTEILNWIVQGNISHTNPTDDETGNILPNRSEDQFRLMMDQTHGQFSYGASLIASSERYTSSNRRVAGYGITNLRAAWKVNSNWTIKAKIDNLFDKDYATTESFLGLPFHAQDRFVFASIQYEM